MKTHKGNRLKVQNVYRDLFSVLYIVVSLLLFVLWLIDIAINKDQSLQLDLFSGRMNNFLADFTNPTGYCAFRSPYDNIAYADFLHKQYPPFAYIFFWLFSKFSWKMESYYAENRFIRMYQEPFFLFMLFLTFIICGIAIFELIRQNKTGSQLMRNGVAFSALLSFPVFFTIGTGNNTLFAAIFTMIYLFWYDSSNRYQREIALISLAAAAATKLAPAIFGILLLYEKRWKDALRTIIYGVVLGVLPFCVFGGGIRYNLPLWIRNLRMAVEGHSPFEGCSIAALILGFIPHALDSESARMSILLINYVFCAFLLVLAPIYRHRWETVLAVSIVVLSIQGQSWYYCLLYMVPFIIMFLNEENFSLRCLCIWVAIIVMMSPYMFFSNILRSKVFLCIFLSWLIMEGVRQLLRLRCDQLR